MKVLTNKKIILILTLILYLAFGIFHLSHFETADEHYWINNDRIHRYWKAIGEGDLKDTRINDKPGITLAYVSGIGMLFEKNNTTSENSDNLFQVSNAIDFQHNLLSFRLPLLIFNGLFIFFFYWIIKKLTASDWIPLWAAIFIGLSPILLGISQIVNPDSLFWVFSSSTILCFLAFLYREEKKLAILTSVFLGLTLATKYVGIVLFPFLLLNMALYFYFEARRDAELNRKILKISLSYLGIIAGSILVFSILMPAVFVKSKYLMGGLINFNHLGYVFGAVIGINILMALDAYFLKSHIILWLFNRMKGLADSFPRMIYGLLFILFSFGLFNLVFHWNILGFSDIPFDSRQSDLFNSLAFYKQFILQLRPLIFSLTPLVLILLFYVWGKSIFQKGKYDFIVLSLSLFFIVYYLAVTTQGLLVTVRYGIILQPLSMILAAIGLWELSEKYRKHFNKLLITFGLILVSLVSLWLVRPFYFNYANVFLPNDQLISNSWGVGGWEAAEYLNSLPNAKNITVISDYSGVCSFVIGRCAEFSNDIRKKLISDIDANVDNPDYYYVLTRRGQTRWGYIFQFNRFYNKKPQWELNIDGRPDNYVRVYQTGQ